jgi:ribonuclease R
MLAANVCAADLLERHKQHTLYRVHAAPAKTKLDQLRTFLGQMGLTLGGGDDPSASDYAELLPRIRERPDAVLLQTMLLRSMQQAVYSPENIGHFGLSYEAYAHFTSPIRRYPDLLTHRAIKAVLAGKRYEPRGIDTSTLNTTLSPAARRQAAEDKAAGKKKSEGELAVWESLGIHCSANERRADEASRDVEAWLKCYFIRDRLGEEFSGTISGVAPFGIFVQLDNLFIEGMVHVTELGADYFQYDETRHELRGERTGKRYQLTDRVTVQVSRVDLDARKIDLRLINEPDFRAQMKSEARRADGEKAGKRRGNGAAQAVPVLEAPDASDGKEGQRGMPWGAGTGSGSGLNIAPANGGKRGAKRSGSAPGGAAQPASNTGRTKKAAKAARKPRAAKAGGGKSSRNGKGKRQQ